LPGDDILRSVGGGGGREEEDGGEEEGCEEAKRFHK
jgi:hypothetical protein